MVFTVDVVVGPSISDGDGVILVSLVIRILIFSFLFFGLSLDLGHCVSEKIEKDLLVLPVKAFVMKVAFGVVFTNFVKIVHV